MNIFVKNTPVGVSIDTYRLLFDNSIYYDHTDYLESLKSKRIAFSDLKRLSREASINYALFFAPFPVVRAMIEKENSRIFQGFGGKFSVSIRGHVFSLNSIRMVIKDIKIKQNFIARHVRAPKNPHLKYLAKSKRSLDEQAEYILNAMNIDMAEFRAQKSKLGAMWYLIDSLESQNIFVSIEAQTNMPQNMNHADGVSGVYIKDSRFPYFFIANEGQANFGDGAGRKIFTIFYLLVCMFKGRSRLVALSDTVVESQDAQIYALVEHILMPEDFIGKQDDYTIDDIDRIAETLKVTSRALLVRLRHLGLIDDSGYRAVLSLLKARYSRYLKQQKILRESGKKRFMPNIPNNIVAYHGKAYLKVLKNLYSNGKVSQRQLNLHLSYGKQTVDTVRVFSKVKE